MNSKTRKLARAGIVAALYASLTLIFAFVSFSTSGFQIRVSEALTVLPLLFPESVLGLFVGCAVVNVVTGNIMDIVIGSVATLAASLLTLLCSRIENKHIKLAAGIIPPIAVNAFLVPVTYTLMSGTPELYFPQVVIVGVGQALAVGILGTALYYGILGGKEKRKWKQETKTD